jgi:hypothetical protein
MHRIPALVSSLALAVCSSQLAVGQTIAPQYAANYSISSIGSVPGVPASYGGLTFSATDPDVLLIGGAANGSAGAVYSIRVRRNQCQEIIGFVGTAVLHSTAPQIDGGLTFTSDGVLLSTGFNNNVIMMTRPGSTAPDKTVQLTPLGVASSTGSLMIVPPGAPGAGRFKIVSYSASRFYDATLSPDGLGTYNISNITQTAQIQGGPEGIVYVPTGSPGFSLSSLLISEYGSARIAAYDVNAQGDPVPATRRDFVTGVSGAEGALIDPVSGNFLFSTFGGGNQVLVVKGFVVERTCDSIDFNGDGLFPDTGDIDDFLSVFSGGSCTGDPNCGDLDFNNDCLFPDTSDIDSLLSVFSGGPCL